MMLSKAMEPQMSVGMDFPEYSAGCKRKEWQPQACSAPAALPSPKVRGAKLDLNEIAALLSPLCKQLDAQLTTVAREEREAQVTLATKNAAQERFDQTYGAVASLLAALLVAAGQSELASRVRPSLRRGSSQDEEPAPSPSPPPSPPPSDR